MRNMLKASARMSKAITPVPQKAKKIKKILAKRQSNRGTNSLLRIHGKERGFPLRKKRIKTPKKDLMKVSVAA